tara:strand:- start:291 stop:542 length:252 start_codon:yes stop_codon:yes gene_type:complete
MVLTGVVLVLPLHNKRQLPWAKLAKCLVVPIRVSPGYSHSMLRWLDSLAGRHKVHWDKHRLAHRVCRIFLLALSCKDSLQVLA